MSKDGRGALERGLREIYDIESRLLAVLPKMVSSVSDPQLAKTFDNHHRVTKKHLERLKKVFDQLKKQPRRVASPVVKELIEDLESNAGDGSDAGADLRAILIALQLEHIEMASYEFLMKLALAEGLKRAVSQFDKNLGEEKKATEDLEDLIGSIADPSSKT